MVKVSVLFWNAVVCGKYVLGVGGWAPWAVYEKVLIYWEKLREMRICEVLGAAWGEEIVESVSPPPPRNSGEFEGKWGDADSEESRWTNLKPKRKHHLETDIFNKLILS